MKLEIGYPSNFEIRTILLESDLAAGFTLLYLSDLHFNGFSFKILTKLIVMIQTLNPDLILLGGDYVDSKKGLKIFEQLLKSISSSTKVFAVEGNHDRYFYTKQIRGIIDANKVNNIEKSTEIVNLKGINIKIDGNIQTAKSYDFNICCLHKPLENAQINSEYQLVLAGHLHGCQFVFWKNGENLYPGRLCYKMNFLQKQLKKGTYLISKGLGDTLPLRYNCPKDIIFVKVTPKVLY